MLGEVARRDRGHPPARIGERTGEAGVEVGVAVGVQRAQAEALHPRRRELLRQRQAGARLVVDVPVGDDGEHGALGLGNGQQGTILDIKNRENLTEPRKTKARMAAIDAVGVDNMIVFAPENPKHSITVFTDIDCGYCRKLHREIDQYNEAGIGVRYLFYPRAGVGSPSFKKAISVWCADDKRQALTDAKNGKDPAPKECENPVADHFKLGGLLGVSGTPAVVLDDGQMVPGYVPAERMAAFLAQRDEQEQEQAKK